MTFFCQPCQKAYEKGQEKITNQEIMVIGGEPILVREISIRWHDEDEETTRTVALTPENWQDKDISQHPADDSIFYWLDAYEWIRLANGDDFGDWTVIEA